MSPQTGLKVFLFCLVLRRKRAGGVPGGGSAEAPETRAEAGPRCLKAAREDAAQTDVQTGLPHPGHGGGGLGSPGNPGSPSELPGT
jgi:hypothetical protein